jgi:hypothetical protein
LPDNSAVLEDSTDFSSNSTVDRITGFAKHLTKNLQRSSLHPTTSKGMKLKMTIFLLGLFRNRDINEISKMMHMLVMVFISHAQLYCLLFHAHSTVAIS